MTKDIEKFENSPTNESMRWPIEHTKNRAWSWKPGKGAYRKIDNRHVWVHVERIFKKYKGKNVDKAFSEFCEKVDKHQQNSFWDGFVDNFPLMTYKKRFTSKYPFWYVDKNKCIQEHIPKKQSKVYSIYSPDHEWGYKNLETGELIHTNGYHWQYRYSSKYERVTVAGEKFDFDSKGPDYQKCYAENIDKQRKLDREAKIKDKEVKLSFLSKSDKDLIESKKQDEIIKQSKGFTDESFTSINGRLND